MGTVPVPVCTYTIPCFASVGLTTEAAKEAGYEPLLGTFNYEANGMALAEGASGAVFAVMDQASGKTLGVTILGENASEMIAFAATAVADGTTVDQWERMIVAHPSLCEMVREAALDAFGKSVHKGFYFFRMNIRRKNPCSDPNTEGYIFDRDRRIVIFALAGYN